MIGACYKRCALGASGVEAIPHIDFWRHAGELVLVGCSRTRAFVTRTPWVDDVGSHERDAGFGYAAAPAESYDL